MQFLQKSRFLLDGFNAIMNDARELPEAVKGKDPAARSAIEVLLLYPGVKAVMLHRVSHSLWQMEAKFTARMLSEVSRVITGVEIHPGAELGRRVVIDHGMGTVIGETAVIGDDCLIFQNVTLGSSRFRQGRRHPTLERGVVVGVGATVIGAVRVGEESKIGAGAVVVSDVEPNTTVTGIPASPKRKHLPDVRANVTIPLRKGQHKSVDHQGRE
jgi:serine O-acetyltransferase